MLSLPDHFLAFLIGIVLPFYGFPAWRKLKRQALLGRAGARKRLYIRTMLIEWFLALCVLLVWSLEHRPLSELGFSINSSSRFLVILGVSLMACIALFRQLNQVVNMNGDFPDRLKAQMRTFAGIIPETPAERRLFSFLSFTAGVCEELFYRGFLIWYLALQLPVIVAAVVSTLLFAIGHGYQGASGLRKTIFAGGVLTVFYLVSGSLIASIILHFITNLTTGLIGSEILKYSEV
jgi:CAAX protease family protein